VQGAGEEEVAEPAGGGHSLQEVEMENAKLRAQVADLYAQECVRELQQPLVPTPGEPAPVSPRGQPLSSLFVCCQTSSALILQSCRWSSRDAFSVGPACLVDSSNAPCSSIFHLWQRSTCS